MELRLGLERRVFIIKNSIVVQGVKAWNGMEEERDEKGKFKALKKS